MEISLEKKLPGLNITLTLLENALAPIGATPSVGAVLTIVMNAHI